MATQDQEDVTIEPARGSSEARQMNESSSDLDRVREILFGEQAREQDRTFQSALKSLRQDLLLQLESHRESAQKRMDEMETQWRSELKDLEQRLDSNASQDEEARDQMQAGLTAEIAALSSRMESGLKELRSKSESELIELTRRLERENAELREELGARSAELSENKADRTVLSELLTDLASRLNDRQNSEPSDS